jgi:hypothetical protein
VARRNGNIVVFEKLAKLLCTARASFRLWHHFFLFYLCDRFSGRRAFAFKYRFDLTCNSCMRNSCATTAHMPLTKHQQGPPSRRLQLPNQTTQSLNRNHSGSIRRRRPLSRLKHRITTPNLPPRHSTSPRRMSRPPAPPLLAIMTATRLNPTNHERRIRALKNLDAHAVGTVKGEGLYGLHRRLRICGVPNVFLRGPESHCVPVETLFLN